jgi:Family of unknown function (DUF6340)
MNNIQMKTVTTFLFAILILFSLSSCSSFILVQKTYDPEIILENPPFKIVFVNIFDYTSPAYVREKQENSYHAGVMKLVEGLSSFSKDKSFSILIGDTLKKDIPSGQLTASLPKDTIQAICESHKTDMLLTLDSLNIFFDWETIVNNDNEGKEKVKNFYLYTRFYLSFYKATGDLINRSMIENSSLYKSRVAMSALITFKPSIAKAIEAVKPLSFQAGEDYVGKFYPKTVQESRKIYAGKAFKESNLFIKLRNWDKATELLDLLAKSPDSNIAAKARHNLSVVKEAALLEE